MQRTCSKAHLLYAGLWIQCLICRYPGSTNVLTFMPDKIYNPLSFCIFLILFFRYLRKQSENTDGSSVSLASLSRALWILDSAQSAHTPSTRHIHKTKHRDWIYKPTICPLCSVFSRKEPCNMDKSNEILFNQSALQSLRRAQLIALCKRYGIKQNGKVRFCSRVAW